MFSRSYNKAPGSAPTTHQIRGMLRAPEVVISTWRAAQSDAKGVLEDEARTALAALEPIWAELFPGEQARIIQVASSVTDPVWLLAAYLEFLRATIS